MKHKNVRSLGWGFGFSLAAFTPHHPLAATTNFDMDPGTQENKTSERALAALNVFIEGLNLAKEVASATPAKAVFGSVAVLLSMIRVSSLSTCVYMSIVG